jgi:hypothetical protein
MYFVLFFMVIFLIKEGKDDLSSQSKLKCFCIEDWSLSLPLIEKEERGKNKDEKFTLYHLKSYVLLGY